ncbi:response regulator [Parachitinimonas caeni]|uniref:Response regulator n=1 Tax=Parachitinimonas caeni TaxID=3031301 RepID=A0ABT7DU55_9NEIS|nr:response regulator [Parachitinimonas caeni]MDK2123619.1 response regulator [Parachitinimonas caeni]
MAELKKILYVEDEPDIRTVAKLALEMVGGFTLEVCSSGAEALEKGPGFQPQLILLDVMMPGMDGPTTLGELRKLPGFASTPAIFMTAKAQPSEVAHFLSLGAAEVIPKPFDPMSLAEQIRAVWAKLG